MKWIGLASALIILTGCGLFERGQTNVTVNNGPTGPSGTNTTTKIEYRVTGNASSVRIRYFNVSDGLIQTVTTLPFTTSFTTTESSLFLSLDVTPLSWPTTVTSGNAFLSAQIFAAGNLFREDTSNDFLSNTLSVNGTWRR